MALDAARRSGRRARRAEAPGRAPSLEGRSLVGSANKRLAAATACRPRERGARGMKATIAAYGEAERLARQRGDSGSFYPALNRIGAELVLHDAGEREAAAAQATALKALRAEVAARHAEQPDLERRGIHRLDLYENEVTEQRLAARLEGLLAAFADVQRRCADASRWESVATQAAFVLDGCIGSGASTDASAARRLRRRCWPTPAQRRRKGADGPAGTKAAGTAISDGHRNRSRAGREPYRRARRGATAQRRRARRRPLPPAIAQRPPVTSSTVPVE
ncbi:MAG: hypothetical protein U1F49_01390 [Rubrivivax sp.]